MENDLGGSRRRGRETVASREGAGIRAGLADTGRPRGQATRRGRPMPTPTGPSYAALDLGTNNCRLLVATPNGGAFEVTDSFSRIVRLGQGLEASGRLSEPAIERTIKALRVCAGKIRRGRVRAARTIATEACRRAENVDVFLDRVRNEAGIELEIINTAEEARLSVLGCAPLIEADAGGVLVIDIGGGSTELTWMERDDAGELERSDWISLPVGVVSMAERFGGEIIARDTYNAMMAWITERLADFPPVTRAARLIDAGRVQIVGTSGTLTTLAGVHMKLRSYDRSRVDGQVVTFEDMRATAERLRAMTLDERGRHPCIGRSRADLVVAGGAILEAICEAFPVGWLSVADRGLREGMLYELMRADLGPDVGGARNGRMDDERG